MCKLNKITICLPCSLVLCILLLISGCTSQSPETVSTSAPVTSIPITTTQSYVGTATQFVTYSPTQTYSSYPTKSTVTPSPETLVCLIDSKEQVFTNDNTVAIAFNLVNPPMYINYTVQDTKPDPDGKYASYYQITIRNKSTGDIYSQSEFGKDTHNGGYYNLEFWGNDVIKVTKSGDLLIETSGKSITLNTEMWVKPEGNLGNSFDVNNTKCIYWPENYQHGTLHGTLGFNFAVESP
jgi:hypothetical protein